MSMGCIYVGSFGVVFAMSLGCLYGVSRGVPMVLLGCLWGGELLKGVTRVLHGC